MSESIDVIKRFKFLRDIHMIPASHGLDYEKWLDNFCGDDKEIAVQILNFFIFIPDETINQMLRCVVGRCGYYFSKEDSLWTHDSFKNNCWYSFIQGEKKDDITDSGYLFPRKLRDCLGISSKRILKFDNLFDVLECNSSNPQNVILVDDFVGTGAQTINAWKSFEFGERKYTLKELVESFKHRIVYAPLVVNESGLDRIARDCKELHMEFVYKLGPEYNLLNVDGLCWHGDKERFSQFCALLKKISTNEQIPAHFGAEPVDINGYNNQGLALAFEHGIPDACPAFFYWKSKTWKPLKERYYHR